ncbi:MAG: hypothetical protein M3203_15925 [Actinomycetota bacterium]|nr:hypothetical protein [Actinomycetota bacterium]
MSYDLHGDLNDRRAASRSASWLAKDGQHVQAQRSFVAAACLGLEVTDLGQPVLAHSWKVTFASRGSSQSPRTLSVSTACANRLASIFRPKLRAC